MTYIRSSKGSKQPVSQPQTHVFIIGVGDYPALRDNSNIHKVHSRMNDKLTSAPESAKALATWFLKEFDQAATPAPLGSVEMLLSPAQNYDHPDGFGSIAVDEATISQIEQSFQNWFGRCNTNRDNVAVFYFVGHGVLHATQLLFAEDVFKSQAQPLNAAIDFDLTFLAMRCCKASTQFFFVDACRVTNGHISTLPVSDAVTLRNFSASNQPRPRNELLLYAAQVNEEARGMVGGISRFTNALINHLKGLGATKLSSGYWAIHHNEFGFQVKKSMMRDNILVHKSKPQTPDPIPSISLRYPSVLYNLAGPPEIPIRLSCSPGKATVDADLSATDNTKAPPAIKSRSSGIPEPWQEKLIAGTYSVEAQFPSGSAYKDNTEIVAVEPPYFDHEIKV